MFLGLSFIIFVVIQLPPGDFVELRIQQLRNAGTEMSQSEIDRLLNIYNLDKPFHRQYLIWMGKLARGDLGRSYERDMPVSKVIGDRLALTMVVSIVTLAFTWAVAIPIGIYSATHQYSFLDYSFTFLGFLGVSIPGFLLALIVIYAIFAGTGLAMTGLFSPQFVAVPWSFAKVLDLLKHIPLPMAIIGLAGTASLIRVTRGMMLDELGKQYVITARAKGVPEGRLLFKYPVRLAINPLISTIGWLLPTIISGEALVSIVMNLPTVGPLMLHAVMVQDMPLAGSFLLMVSLLTLVGTLVSDILLAVVDPRIRFGAVGETE